MLRKLPLSRAPYGQHMQKRPHVCSGPSEEQPDAFLTRRIHATPLEDLSSQSPCCWLQPPIYKMKRVKSVNAAATSPRWPGRPGFCADPWHGRVPSPPQAYRPVRWGRWKWSPLKVLRALNLNVLMELVNVLSCRCIEGSDCWKEKKHGKINGPVSLEDSPPADTSCLFLVSIAASSWRLNFTIWLCLSH